MGKQNRQSEIKTQQPNVVALCSEADSQLNDKFPSADLWVDGDLVGVGWTSGESLRSGERYRVRVAKKHFRNFAKSVADFADELDKREGQPNG